jgi:hypothetical protein
MVLKVTEFWKHVCPVCGYPYLEEPPERFSICPSCGTEFGNDDFVFETSDQPKKWAELRARWLEAGAPWFDQGTPRPLGWDPRIQLLGAGLAHSTFSNATSTADYVGTRPSLRVQTVGTRSA